MIFKFSTAVIASTILLILAAMVVELYLQSKLSMDRFGLGFLWGTTWDPAITQIFSALPVIYGTLVTSLLALLFGVPLSLGTAIVLSEMAPHRFKSPVSFIVELLAAIPSVIFGLWGIFTLAPFLRDYIYPQLQNTLGFLPIFQGSISGLGVLTGGIILAIMIIPTVSAVSRDVLAAVPESQREAALALGATKWETTRTVLSYGRSGIIGAIILGLGRAVGETMAITMVIGNRFGMFTSLFGPGYTMAAVIANEFTEATTDLYLSALIEVGLILFLVAMAVNVLARLIVWRSLRMVRGAVFE
jgi:phosphate transport system permease protein